MKLPHSLKPWWPIVALLPGILLAQQRPVAPAATQPFTISLPPTVRPEAVHIDYGFRHGDGLSMGTVQARAGVYDYTISADSSGLGPPASLKLAIYIPGYRMVVQEFTREELQAGRPFIPQLVPLLPTTVKGRLIDTAGNPMKDEPLKIEYFLSEVMDYFGYADGMVPTIFIADTSTDGSGEFAVAVPSLFDDPFFQGSRSPGSFQFGNGKEVRGRDYTLNPGSFPLQKIREPLTIRKTQKGTLTGKLGKELLRQNNLSEDLRVYVRPRDTIVTGIELRATGVVAGNQTSFNARLNIDGSFELQVPAGKYDLDLWVAADNYRRIPIEHDFVLEENTRRVLELP